MNDLVVVTERITKIYPNGVKANVGVSIEVYRGEAVCLMGPNGAGKTTLVRQVIGVLKPTSGKVTVLGFNPAENQDVIRKEVSYTPQLPLVYPSHKVIEVAKYIADLSGTPCTRMQEVLQSLGLWGVKDRMGYQLSVGQRKLLLLALSLIKNSELLILDEPTSFIDIFKKRIVWDVLMREKSKGKTMLLVSHDLEEVKRLCDRVYLMVYGKVVNHFSTLEKVEGGAEVRLMTRHTDKVAQLLKRSTMTVNEGLVVAKYKSLLDALIDLENLAFDGELRDDVKIYLEYPSIETLLESYIKGW